MATIKQTSNALGNLINQINSTSNTGVPNQFTTTLPGNMGQQSTINIDDESIPTNMLNPEPVFEINYKSTQKQCIKKAKQQLEIIVKEVVPSLLQNSSMITDKISQDADQLGQLYYQAVCSDKMLQALMETVARGETQARLFEVYSKMSKQQEDLASKITETQNQMRKYYIDTYLDLQQKDNADDMISSNLNHINNDNDAPTNALPFNGNNTIVGTENTIKMINERKKQALIAKYQEVNDNV